MSPASQAGATRFTLEGPIQVPGGAILPESTFAGETNCLEPDTGCVDEDLILFRVHADEALIEVIVALPGEVIGVGAFLDGGPVPALVDLAVSGEARLRSAIGPRGIVCCWIEAGETSATLFVSVSAGALVPGEAVEFTAARVGELPLDFSAGSLVPIPEPDPVLLLAAALVGLGRTARDPFRTCRRPGSHASATRQPTSP